MEHSDQHESFVRQLTENQNRIYGYVYSLLGDHSQAADVVQEANVVLWRKIGEFESGKPFLPWAFAVARFQVLAHLRDRKRDKVLLDGSLVELIGVEAEQHAERIDGVREALRPCLEALPPVSREMIHRRYTQQESIEQVARAFDRTSAATKVALMRIRRSLADCIQKRVAAEV